MDGASRPLPIGVDSFRKIREEGYYFIDKTELISDILEQKSEAYLFTRPRRFGKTTNLSMLDAFFNIKYRGNTWFDGLWVSEHPEYDRHKNRHPVIYLNLKETDVSTYDDFVRRIRVAVCKAFEENCQSIDVDALTLRQRELFQSVLELRTEEVYIRDCIPLLCELLDKCYGVKPIILIDEYDRAVTDAYGQEYQKPMIDLLGRVMSAMLKSNDHLQMAIVTGITQISKESIFSGLNNLYVNNVFSKDYGERYGFTPAEVLDLCTYYGDPDAFSDAKAWYDGYRFGGAEIYNPWSVLNFIQAGFDPKPYWAGTSRNDIIDRLLESTDDETYDDLQRLGNGGTLCGKDVSPTVAMDELLVHKDSIYSVMVMTGYLNAIADDAGYSLCIPNKEMYGIFLKAIASKGIGTSAVKFAGFFNAAERNDCSAMEEFAFSIFAEHFQDWDLPDEGAYRRILAGAAMSLCGRYTVTTEGQAGNGRADLIMKRNTPSVPNVVMEFNKSKEDDSEVWCSDAEEGIRQIKTKEYFHSLKGRTILYGIAMFNKKAKVLSEVIELRWARGHIFYRGCRFRDRCLRRSSY